MLYDKRMKTYSSLKEKYLKDPDVRREYDKLKPRYELIESIIKKRIEKGLSQKDLANMIETKQSAISRIESGNYNPSFNLIQKITKALDSELEIKII